MEIKLDLTISQSQLRLRSRACSEADFQWGPGNLVQGLVVQDGLLMLDPLSEETFDASITIRVADSFTPDAHAQRTLQAPFAVVDAAELAVSSPSEEMHLPLDVTAGDYTVIYEVCLGPAVYFVFTLIPIKTSQAAALQTDGWGLEAEQKLAPGVF
ncbi:MAG: competence protein ComJ [bacterium]|nr:competence protein ComJ [bacterium]